MGMERVGHMAAGLSDVFSIKSGLWEGGSGGFGGGGSLLIALPGSCQGARMPAQAPPAFMVRPGSHQPTAWPLEAASTASPPCSFCFLHSCFLSGVITYHSSTPQSIRVEDSCLCSYYLIFLPFHFSLLKAEGNIKTTGNVSFSSPLTYSYKFI